MVFTSTCRNLRYKVNLQFTEEPMRLAGTVHEGKVTLRTNS